MKKSLTLFLSLLLVALYFPGSAQTWTQSGPFGGNITGITSNSTSLFVGAKNEYGCGGAWISTDNGQNWENVIDNLPATGTILQTVGSLMDTCLFIATQGTGSATSDGGIYKSVDDGLTWSHPYGQNYSTFITCFHAAGTSMFAGSNNGPIRSTNYGDTWALARTGMNTGLARAVKCFLSSGDTLFAGTRAGVYRSINNGYLWTASTSGIPLTAGTYWAGWITGLAKNGSTLYASTFEQGIYKSTDKGITWSPANNGSPEMNHRTVYVSGSVIYTATLRNGVYKSLDNGASWVQASSGLPNMEISCLLQNEEKLFAGGFDGIYQTIDNGLSWTSSNNNLAGFAIRPMTKAGNYLFAGSTSGRVFRSSDNGDTWQIASGAIRSPGGSFTNVQALGSVGSTVLVSYYDSLYRSTDWGNQWTGIQSAVISSGSNPYDMATAGSRIFCVNGTVLFSDDEGITWNIHMEPTAANKLCVKGEDVYSSINNTVSKSISGTGQFILMGSLADPSSFITGMTALDDILYAGSNNGGVFESTDDGVTWINAGLSDSSIVAITSTAGRLFARTKHCVFQKALDNNTWEPVSMGLLFNLLGGGTALFGDQGNLYTAVSAKSVYKADVTQFAFPAQPDPISGSATPCIGSTLTYSVTNVAGVTYAWQFPSDWVVTAGGNTNSVTVVVGSESGTIMVTPSTGWGAGPSQLMTVSPEPYVDPAVSIAVDQNNICAGTLSTFTATISGGGITPIYQWFVNGVEVGENNSVYAYIATNNDVVDMQLTSSLACAISNPVQSNSITLVVYDVAVVTAAISVVENSICEGGEMAFYATTTGGGDEQEFNWLVNNISAGVNAESFIYTPADGDVVSLIFTSSEICTTENPVESNTITAIVNELPEVSWTNSELDTICLESTAFLLTGGLPAGGTYTGTGVVDNTFYPSTAGTGYHTIIYSYMDGNGCSSADSLTLFVDVCSGVAVLGTDFSIYPNPASENITITLGGDQVIETIALFNSMGAKVYEKGNLKTKGTTTIPVQDLPSGSYFLRIVCGNQIYAKAVIVN